MSKYIFCAEVIEGLEDIAREEITKVFGGQVNILNSKSGVIYFKANFDLKRFYNLRTVNDIYLFFENKHSIDSQEFKKILLEKIQTVIKKNSELYSKEVATKSKPEKIPENFKFLKNLKTFKFTSYKADLPKYRKLKKYISDKTNLYLVFHEGDLLIKKVDKSNEWRIRVSNKSLSSREWRVANYKGGLSGTIASCMIHLTNPTKEDNVLNICAGSGTLMIERTLLKPMPNECIGVEIEHNVIEAAKRNFKQSDIPKKFKILQGDVTKLIETLKVNGVEEKFNVVFGDLPFGLSIGKVDENAELYDSIFKNLKDVVTIDCKISLITQDVNSMKYALERNPEYKLERKFRLNITTKRGKWIHPTVYLFDSIT